MPIFYCIEIIAIQPIITRTRKSYLLPVVEEKKELCKIHVYGDGTTNTVVKKFIASTPLHKENETIHVKLENQRNWWKDELILGEPLNEIYNDAEFDVLLSSPRSIAALDRESILRAIHSAISDGASCLRETLKTPSPLSPTSTPTQYTPLTRTSHYPIVVYSGSKIIKRKPLPIVCSEPLSNRFPPFPILLS